MEDKDIAEEKNITSTMKERTGTGNTPPDSIERTEERKLSPEGIQDIFDKIFKKIITLSAKAVINLINGLFGTDYPRDSTITYNWTEFEDERLKKILADTIITINGKYSYHLEAQIEKDSDIVFRVFEYGHALRTRIRKDGKYILCFPRPVVIYLCYSGTVPDEYTLTLEFEEGRGTYEYKVPVLKLPEITSQELSDRKMGILIPFHVLKLRQELKKKKPKELRELQRYILDDIINCINQNLELDNITIEDAIKLKRYLHKLCDYLACVHKELGEMGNMTDESFMTDVDIMCEEHERAMAERDRKLAEQNDLLAEKDDLLAEQNNQLAEKDDLLTEQNNLLKASAKAMLERGMTPEEVHSITRLSLDVIATMGD